jgi:hypothetical protein
VALTRSRGKLAKVVGRHAWLARTVEGRAPASPALTYDDQLGALIQWLPLDVELPALGLPRGELVRRLRAEGVEIKDDDPGSQLLAYKPLSRAVVGLDGHVLKLYAGERPFRNAAAGLAAVAGTDVPTPSLEAAIPDLCAVVQKRIQGVAADDSRAAAVDAGALLRSLHRPPPPGPAMSASRRLAQAAKHGAVVSALLPALGPRVRTLLARLERQAPTEHAGVVSHGDFEAGQLLVGDSGLTLVDLDDLCVAAPALDHANYAAHAVGADGSLADAYAVLALLADGYGETPADLDWYLAASLVCRSSSPFRRFRDDWPERVESLIEAAEEALPR